MANRIEYYMQKGEGMNGVPSRRVQAMQWNLYYLRFLRTAPDGKFGPNTEKAVIKAQKEYEFEENGIVDSALNAKLAEECVYLNPKDR